MAAPSSSARPSNNDVIYDILLCKDKGNGYEDMHDYDWRQLKWEQPVSFYTKEEADKYRAALHKMSPTYDTHMTTHPVHRDGEERAKEYLAQLRRDTLATLTVEQRYAVIHGAD
jgi:hypothetical protein